MPRKRKKTYEFRINDVVKTIEGLDLSKMMMTKSAHVSLRKASSVGHIENLYKGEVFVRHAGDDNTAVYTPEELVLAEDEAFWRYHHSVDGVQGYSEFRTYVQAVKCGQDRGEKTPTITGPIYEAKEELDLDFALPVRSMFDLLGDDDD